MTAAIVGGAGFVGSHLANALGLSGAKPAILDLEPAFRRLRQPNCPADMHRNRLLDGADCHVTDVRSREGILDSLQRVQPVTVYYLAAMPIVAEAEARYAEAADSMVRGLANTLEATRMTRSVKRFVFVSSSMVYGHFDVDPVPEDAPLSPLSVYGGFKLAGEQLVRAYLETSEISYVIARPSGVYGPGDPHGRVVQKFCEAAVESTRVQAVNAAETIVDFTWVGDLAAGLVAAGDVRKPGSLAYNLTRGHGRSLSELASIVGAQAPTLEVDHVTRRNPLRPKRGSLDVSRARRDLGFNPQVDLEEGVAAYLAHLRTETRPALSRVLELA
jgi:nucleoside-diphosphate-sugar epimerase